MLQKFAWKSPFQVFCRISKGKKWSLENLLKIEKITQKSFFRTFCRIFEGKKMDFGKFFENCERFFFFFFLIDWISRAVFEKSPKIIFSDFLQDFWREKTDFKNIAHQRSFNKIIHFPLNLHCFESTFSFHKSCRKSEKMILGRFFQFSANFPKSMFSLQKSCRKSEKMIWGRFFRFSTKFSKSIFSF